MNHVGIARWAGLLLLATVAACAVAWLHGISLSRQLSHSQQQVTDLKRQLATATQQRCAQTYDWTSNTRYPAVVESMGHVRTYSVHTPASYSPDQRYPMVIAFDGLNGTAARAERESGLDSLPALTVYPDALIGTRGLTAWQGAPYSPAGVNDVQFIDDMIARITRDFCIDTTAVYLVGMSNGAGFAFIAACELRDRVAGVVGISGAYYTPCRHHQYAQPRMLMIHSIDDQLVPVTGDRFRRLPSVYQFAAARGHELGCRQVLAARGVDIERTDWRNCNNDQRLSLITARQQPHGWLHITDTSLVPEGALIRPTTSAVIWDFLTAP